VKLRGFRVEMGEVEAALNSVPRVRAGAAALEGSGEEKELVAYLVHEDAQEADPAAMRKALAARLPAYMIPSRFMQVDSLPLTPNGKVDRGALAAIGRRMAADGAPPRGTRPLTPIESAVADLWRIVLGLRDVGADDEFFEVGGHSLHATRLLALLRRVFRIELPMAALLEATTVARLAAALVEHEPAPGHALRASRALAKLATLTDGERRPTAVPGSSEEGRA